MRRRLIDQVIADWHFERAVALGRHDRWAARLATIRAVIALVRVAVYCVAVAPVDASAGDPSRRIAGAVVVATAMITMVPWSISLFALVTGAYAMDVTTLNVALLFVYLGPTALVVTIPVGLSTGILAACGRPSDARTARIAIALLVVLATAVSVTLLAWLSPITSYAYRQLARPIGGDLRVNAPGSVGALLAWHEGWALLGASVVLGTFALSAAAVTTPQAVRVRFWAGVASVAHPLLYVPVGVLAITRVVPTVFAAWLPNALFATAALLLIGWNRTLAATRTAIQRAADHGRRPPTE